LCFAVTSVCGGCVEAVTFKKASRRPSSSDCPVCREKMRKPWVMDGELWEELGGTAFDDKAKMMQPAPAPAP